MATAYRAQDLPGLTKEDEDQLKLLSTLHYCYAVLVALMGLGIGAFGLVPALLFSAAPKHANDPPPLLVGGIFFAIFGFIAAILVAKAVLTGLAGRGLQNRRNHTLVLVAACLSLMNFPLGTALGIFTIMLINKPAVKALFV